MQSCGIGKLLLDYVKDKKVSLRLNVYQKNARAISFYQREAFIIQCEGLDEVVVIALAVAAFAGKSLLSRQAGAGTAKNGAATASELSKDEASKMISFFVNTSYPIRRTMTT